MPDAVRSPDPARSAGAAHRLAMIGLFWVSGMTGLTYEVLWMRQLKLLFGSTSQAAAATLTAFFVGIGLGSWLWGRGAARVRAPLRAYGLLELAVAGAAAAFFLLMDLYHGVYQSLYESMGDHRIAFVAVKFLLSLVVLVPPALFMGGTLPMMSQHLIRRRTSIGPMAALLYAANTAGAAAGALLAGFFLPVWLGVVGAYQAALGVTLAVGLTAIVADRLATRPAAPLLAADPGETPESAEAGEAPLSRRAILWVAALSGFGALGLEVLWTRMFEQVLQNSVYTFALVLVLFLVCLALGAAIASILARRSLPPRSALAWLLLISAIVTGISPAVFNLVTSGLIDVAMGTDWATYIWRVGGIAGLVIAPACIVIGTVFPFLMKAVEPYADSAGRSVGRLAAINTIGAILGSLAAGFFLIEITGTYLSIRAVAGVYAVAGLVLVARSQRNTPFLALGALAILALAVAGRADPPKVFLGPQEQLVADPVEGASGTVAVVDRSGARWLKVNNLYSLGSTANVPHQQRQAHLPLLINTDAASVYFLGMGTGISAGAAVDHPVDRIVVSEIIPEVIDAARIHFAPVTNGLFEDDRVTVIAEDGRNHLHGTTETFDAIIADLFVPWRAGVGGLYTVDHYRRARDRLNPGGIYVQWLPLYQMTERHVGIIARTMTQSFERVTLWRGDFRTQYQIAALIGHADDLPLDPATLDAVTAIARNEQRRTAAIRNLVIENTIMRDPAMLAIPGSTVLMFYAGDVSTAPRLFEQYPINTDDRPVIEYESPIDARRQQAGRAEWLSGRPFIELVYRLQDAAPPSTDPYLARLTDRQRSLVGGAAILHEAQFIENTEPGGPFWQAVDRFKRVTGIE